MQEASATCRRRIPYSQDYETIECEFSDEKCATLPLGYDFIPYFPDGVELSAEPSALRIDVMIAIFAMGVALGMLIP